MKKFEKFLFLYSIIAVTIFFVSFGIFSPTPLNFISGVLMLPMAFYFWIKLTEPEHTSAGTWSIRFLITLFILSLLGVFGFYLLTKALPENRSLTTKIGYLEAQNKDLSDKIEGKDAELSKFKEKTATPSANVKGIDTKDITIADLVVGTQASGSAQRITGNVGQKMIDVYQSTSLTSAKIGSVDGNIIYPYVTKQNDWYKIVLTSTKTGWVSQSQVQEVQ